MITANQPFYKSYKWWWIGLNALMLVVWYFANDGLAFWDDFTYLSFADQVNKGTFEVTTNHFTSRTAIIYPVAWIVGLFGINELSMTIYPLICGLLLLNLIFWYGYTYNPWVAILAGIWLVCDYHTITFITHLFPEIPIALMVFVALLSYDFVNRREADIRLMALLLSASLFGAFLTKTSVFIVVPLFLFLFANDYFFQYKNIAFWRLSAILVVFFFVLNGLYYVEEKGDFFYRFQNISANHEATTKTFFDKSQTTLIKRLTYLPFLGFLRGGFFIPLLLAIPAFFKLRKSDWKLKDSKKIWPIAALLSLISWWFISTNWKYYSPMPVETRHITFIIPMLLMAAANYWSENSLFKKYFKPQFAWVILLPFLAIPAYKISVSGRQNFHQLSALMKAQFVENEAAQRVFTDGSISYGYPYFYNFEETNDEYFYISELKGVTPKAGDFLLYNPPYLDAAYNDFDSLEQLQKQIMERGFKLIPIVTDKLFLYRVE